MFVLVNKESLYNTFGIEDFKLLEGAVYAMAPSLVEYHLSMLGEYCEEAYINKRDIENSLSIGDYNLYIDYSENVYLEIDSSLEDNCTQGFW